MCRPETFTLGTPTSPVTGMFVVTILMLPR
jgi:hypothetical protein